MKRIGARGVGLIVLGLTGLSALAAPILAPTAPAAQHPDHPYAPPMLPRVHDADDAWRAPHVPRLILTDRLASTYATGDALPLRWFDDGRLLTSGDADHPLLLLGADGLGRDVWSRLLHGARYSLGLSAAAVAGATMLGALIGLVAGWRGGWTDAALMGLSDLLVVLPALYVVLLFRAALPLVLSPAALFALMAGVLALAGWPTVARGVRSIVAAERGEAYVQAARGFGAGHWYMLRRHLVPAVLPFLATQAVLLLPAFVVAEATLSFIGLGFAEPTPSWGTLLRDSFNLRVLHDAPWLLSPAAAIALVTIAANLVREGDR